MAAPRSLTVTLPDDLDLGPEDLEVLRTTLQTIVSLAGGAGCCPNDDLVGMQQDGWEVSWALTWIARARRDGAYEEATGDTRDEVLARLGRLVRLHEVEGTP